MLIGCMPGCSQQLTAAVLNQRFGLGEKMREAGAQKQGSIKKNGAGNMQVVSPARKELQ